MSVEVQNLVDDFKVFVAERISNSEILARRVGVARQFLQDPFVARCRLSQRIKFLQLKGFSRPEIEGALELVSEREFLLFAEDRLEDEEVDPAGDAPPLKEGIIPGGGSGVASGCGADAGGAESRDLGRAGQTSLELTDAMLWRIGGNVFAFKGDNSYYCVPLLGFDHSRHEDVFIVAHQKDDGSWGERQFLPEGFKGVVPDEYAPVDLLTVGRQVIAEYPNAHRNHCKDAVIVGVHPEREADDSVLVDIEWSHSSAVTRCMPSHQVRLLVHPKKLAFQKVVDDAEQRRNQGTSIRTTSASMFPFVNFTASFEGREHCHSTQHLKNFIHHPALDVGEQPRSVQSAAAFISQFGQTYHDGHKTFPACPPSQAQRTGAAFGFSLAGFERHPSAPQLFTTNPILEICHQCLARDSMFVDPDFPPSFFSLAGGAIDDAKRFTWRRASEICFRPRVNVIGSKALDQKPGIFSPAWLQSVVGSLEAVAEFEDMISPGEDGWVFGAYVIRMFVDGTWGFVVVDDFVPCDAETGNPVSLWSGNPNEIFPCLVEKALAKIEGSYMAMRFARPSFSLSTTWERLTSNIVEQLEHDLLPSKAAANENLNAFVQQRNSCRVLARCRADTAADERYTGFGFDEGTQWFLDAICLHVPPTRAGGSYFFHVSRATRGGSPVTHIDIKREKFFRTMPREAIDEFCDVPGSGAISYWMSSTEYYSIFDRTTCLWFINNSQRASFSCSFAGRRCGAKMEGFPVWLSNPQLFVSFVQPCEVIIEVRLRDRSFKPNAIRGKGLQLHLLRGPPIERPLTPEDDIQIIAASPMTDLVDDVEAYSCPSSSIRLLLTGGNYVVVPNVGCESDEDLTLKIFSISAFYVKLLN